jgi:4-amino-4-deoxy-L-arabinose transferase-like glycosyltransferase
MSAAISLLTSARQRPFLLLTILVAFALRALTLDAQSLWRDEIDAIYFALRPLPETLSMFTQMAQNGPVYFLSLRPWLQFAGSSEIALRFPSLMAGVLAVPLLWQISRRLVGGGGAALLTSVLLAVNPYALWYSQEGKMYALVLLLVMAANYCLLRAMATGGWRWWVLYALAVTLSIYVHLLCVLVLPLHMLWFVIAWPQSRRHWLGFVLAQATLTLPYLPLLRWQWPMLLASTPMTGFRYTPLVQTVQTVLLNQGRGFAPALPLLVVAPAFFAGLVGLLVGWSEADLVEDDPVDEPSLSPVRRHLLVVSWFALPVLGIWLISLRQPVFTDRYVIWGLPAALILISQGVRVMRYNLGAISSATAILLSGWIIGAWLYVDWQQTTKPIKYELRDAVQYLYQHRDPSELMILQIPHLEYAYRYYSGDQGRAPFAQSDERLGRWIGGLWTNDGRSDEETAGAVDLQMRQATAQGKEVWLLTSEPEMWDQRRMMDQWLKENAVAVEQASFLGAQVTHYRLNPSESLQGN